MNQQVTTFNDASKANEVNSSKLASQGQFAYFANPANLWPDFLLGQANQPLRVILIEENAHCRADRLARRLDRSGHRPRTG